MIDLHLHLDGSLKLEIVPVMARMSGVELNCCESELKRKLMVEPDCTNLGEYLEKFDLPLKLLQTEECIEYAVYELLRELSTQGLCYAEIRFAPQLHNQRKLSQDEVVQAAISGMNKGIGDFSLSANLILCCMRGNDNHNANLETIAVAEKYLGKGVCAVDLAGNEAAYPTKQFEDVFMTAKCKKIPIIIHAGEAAGPDSIREALECGAVRIGHGIHAIEDIELISVLKKSNIYLEMCYSSNIQTRTVNRPEDYPIVEFLANGLNVTLNTDNITVSNTTLKREYLLVKRQFSLSDELLLKIALNSVDAAFLTDNQKAELRDRVKKEFLTWIG